MSKEELHTPRNRVNTQKRFAKVLAGFGLTAVTSLAGSIVPVSAKANNPSSEKVVSNAMVGFAKKIVRDYAEASPKNKKIFKSAGDKTVTLEVIYSAEDRMNKKHGRYLLETTIKTSPGGKVNPANVSALSISEYDGFAIPIYFFNAISIASAQNKKNWSIDLDVSDKSQYQSNSYITGGKNLYNAYIPLTVSQFNLISDQANVILDNASRHTPISEPKVYPPK
jgi:hypothetical protein